MVKGKKSNWPHHIYLHRTKKKKKRKKEKTPPPQFFHTVIQGQFRGVFEYCVAFTSGF